ncbi:MAG: SCO family protein [Ginsengibacter sp.]
MKSLIYSAITILLLFGCTSSDKKSAFEGSVEKQVSTPVGTIPDESLYMLRDTFQTQNNRLVTLASFAGKPTVVGMIFTHCDYACPRLTADIKTIQEKLKKDDGKINFLLVSFDTERDSPEQLKKFADTYNLDKNWTLLHGSEEAVRMLSVLLNVQFIKDAEGNFSHSNIISVLDKNGTLLYQKEGLEANNEVTINTIEGAIK